MQPHTIAHASLFWSSSMSKPPSTCSTKFREKGRSTVSSSHQGSDATTVVLQKESKKDLSRILRTDAVIKGIEKKANSKKYNTLWPKAVLEALDEAIRENRYQSALKIFELLRKQHWYVPRSKTYTKLLMMLSKCKQPKLASLLFEVMLSEGIKPTINVYTALVSAYGKSGLLDEAFNIIEDMQAVSDCKPDVYMFSVLISCCTKLYRVDLIQRILAEMSYLGIRCNTVTYNTIIDGYGKAKMFKKMEKTLTDMIENEDSLPDIFTFNSVIGAYGSGGELEKMEAWYKKFQLMGVQPDIKTFNVLIRSYGRAGMYKKMSSVLDYMEKRFFTPTVVTYNIIIEIFGKSGNIAKMDEHFRKMKYQGMKPNSITYCSLVRAYSRASLIRKVDSTLGQVVNSDVLLDTPFFNCVISAYGQAGDLDAMREMFMAMEEKKCKPDTITFATMIQAYSAHGMVDIVQELENQMLSIQENSGILSPH